MRKLIFLFCLSLIVENLYAEEIPNTLGAVKNAQSGDYIVLQDGSHYVLVEEEIAIVNGQFDYDDTQALQENEVPRADGGVEFHITPAHKRILWPDGKSLDILTTRRAFDDYLRFLARQYDPIPFTNHGEFVSNTYPTPAPEGLASFRGQVYRTFLTNGTETFDYIEVKEFNRTMTGEGLERDFQAKGGTIVTTLSDGGNLTEAGARMDE